MEVVIVESVTFELVRYNKGSYNSKPAKISQLGTDKFTVECRSSQLNAEEEICIDRLEFTVYHL